MAVQTRSYPEGELRSKTGMTQADLIASAESLLQTIIGISQVRVVPHPAGGIAVVRVDCSDDATPGQVMRNIRSALFAGLGISVSPECIDFVFAHEFDDGLPPIDPPSESPAPAAPIVASITPVPASLLEQVVGPIEAPAAAMYTAAGDVAKAVSHPAQQASRPVHTPAIAAGIAAQLAGGTAAQVATVSAAAAQRLMHVVEAVDDDGARRVVTGDVSAPRSRVSADLAAPLMTPVETPDARVPGALGRGVRDAVALAAALRLESVELRRQAGRMRCRVVIALGNDHFGAVADSSDPHAGEIHLAGRVACDALRAGGFTEARFDGATVAQINGREHIVVALSEWTGGETMVLSGAAPLEDTPERAAAIAAIKAVLAQDIN